MFCMTPVPIVAAINLEGWPAMRKSDLNRLKKEAYMRVGKIWLKKMLPAHFRAGAASKYGYEPRSLRHNRRKRAIFHHTQPLVFTGALKREVLSPAGHSVSATSKGARVRLHHHVVHRKVHEELIAVTEPERRELSAVFTNELARLMKTFKGKRRRKLRK